VGRGAHEVLRTVSWHPWRGRTWAPNLPTSQHYPHSYIMSVRWRLGVIAVQGLIVAGATFVVMGRPVSSELWFVAGLAPVAIYPLLLEPYYARPPDIIVNTLICLILYLVVSESLIGTGRDIFAIAVVAALALAVFALAAGAGRKEPTPLVRLAGSARRISSLATARVLYSAVFVLALLADSENLGEAKVWGLVGGWLAAVVVGLINWQSVWSTVTGTPPPCEAEGMVGPSRLLVATSELPQPGSWVSLKSGSTEAEGVVITRIRRSVDVWGQIHVSDGAVCERLLGATGLTIRTVRKPKVDVVGAVDVGSSDTMLRFVATRALETGRVVAIKQDTTEILYQLSAAEIQQSNVKGGSHLVVRVDAAQLGHFDEATRRLRQHRWVPPTGAAVVGNIRTPTIDPSTLPSAWIRLGHVIGTEIPIFLDQELACDGHLVILGMTKMGKTSLAVRLAKALGQGQPVVIMDQSSEYAKRRGLPKYKKGAVPTTPCVSVIEPPDGFKGHPADLAHKFLQELVGVATDEYVKDQIVPRTLILDEAHQFVPEPAGMGFGAPGRESSTKFGMQMMQVRKYGISIMIVSQRTAVVSKSALSQCENFIAFRYVDRTGLDYLETLAGPAAARLVPKLEQGQALVFGPAVSSDGPVAIQVEWEPAGPVES